MENGKPQLLLEHKQMNLRPTMKHKKGTLACPYSAEMKNKVCPTS